MEATRNAIKLDVEQALLAERTTAELVEYYQGGILDKSEQLATLAQKGFEKGATSYLEVLEAQRTLRTIRSDYISAIAAHSKAVAQLEWAANVEMTPDAAPQKASAIEVKR
jgi:cobalt-zinc-cadmium efflux system outer membrane protein